MVGVLTLSVGVSTRLKVRVEESGEAWHARRRREKRWNHQRNVRKLLLPRLRCRGDAVRHRVGLYTHIINIYPASCGTAERTAVLKSSCLQLSEW